MIEQRRRKPNGRRHNEHLPILRRLSVLVQNPNVGLQSFSNYQPVNIPGIADTIAPTSTSSRLTRSTGLVGSILWRPLTRDGGAKLARADRLYNITSLREERTLWYKPAAK